MRLGSQMEDLKTLIFRMNIKMEILQMNLVYFLVAMCLNVSVRASVALTWFYKLQNVACLH